MLKGLLKLLLLGWMVFVVYDWAWVLFFGGHGADEPEASRLFVGYQFVQTTVGQILPKGWVRQNPAFYLDFINNNRWYILKGFAYPIILGTVVLFSAARTTGGFLKHFGGFIVVVPATILAIIELGRVTYNLTRNLHPNESLEDYYKVYFNPEYTELFQSAVRWFSLAF